MASQPKRSEATCEADRIGDSFTACSMTTGSARERRSKRPGWAIFSDGRRWKKNSTPRNNGFGNIPKHSTAHEIDHARSGSRNREEFTAELRENGIDAVFRENDAGRIYGVTFIDRTTHQVFNGSRLGKEYAANAFEAWFNGREQESSTPIQEELRPLAPLEPSQPGLSSVEEFEEYIETHYVSMPDVMGELMEYTPEKEWETAPEYRLFPRRKKRRRKIRKRI